MKKNDNNINRTTGQLRLKGSNDEKFPFCEYILPLSANDYVQLFTSISGIYNVVALAESSPAAGVPDVPSLIFNIYKLA